MSLKKSSFPFCLLLLSTRTASPTPTKLSPLFAIYYRELLEIEGPQYWLFLALGQQKRSRFDVPEICPRGSRQHGREVLQTTPAVTSCAEGMKPR